MHQLSHPPHRLPITLTLPLLTLTLLLLSLQPQPSNCFASYLLLPPYCTEIKLRSKEVIMNSYASPSDFVYSSLPPFFIQQEQDTKRISHPRDNDNDRKDSDEGSIEGAIDAYGYDVSPSILTIDLLRKSKGTSNYYTPDNGIGSNPSHVDIPAIKTLDKLDRSQVLYYGIQLKVSPPPRYAGDESEYESSLKLDDYQFVLSLEFTLDESDEKDNDEADEDVSDDKKIKAGFKIHPSSPLTTLGCSSSSTTTTSKRMWSSTKKRRKSTSNSQIYKDVMQHIERDGALPYTSFGVANADADADGENVPVDGGLYPYDVILAVPISPKPTSNVDFVVRAGWSRGHESVGLLVNGGVRFTYLNANGEKDKDKKNGGDEDGGGNLRAGLGAGDDEVTEYGETVPAAATTSQKNADLNARKREDINKNTPVKKQESTIGSTPEEPNSSFTSWQVVKLSFVVTVVAVTLTVLRTVVKRVRKVRRGSGGLIFRKEM